MFCLFQILDGMDLIIHCRVLLQNPHGALPDRQFRKHLSVMGFLVVFNTLAFLKLGENTEVMT